MKIGDKAEQKRRSQKRKVKRAGGAVPRLTIGLAGFEKVSAIEGLHLTRDMKRTFSRLERQGASPAQRRAAIVKRYG